MGPPGQPIHHNRLHYSREGSMKCAVVLLTALLLVGCNAGNFQPTSQNESSALASATKKTLPQVTGGWEIIATSNQTTTTINETRVNPVLRSHERQTDRITHAGFWNSLSGLLRCGAGHISSWRPLRLRRRLGLLCGSHWKGPDCQPSQTQSRDPEARRSPGDQL